MSATEVSAELLDMYRAALAKLEAIGADGCRGQVQAEAAELAMRVRAAEAGVRYLDFKRSA